MDDFAVKGFVGSGDGMAALAIVRALLRMLVKTRALSLEDVSSITTDAVQQIAPKLYTAGGEEAERLVHGLKQLL